MGIEGNDFIANPNRIDYTDDELDLDDNPEVIIDYMGVEDDPFVGDDDEDDDEEGNDDVAMHLFNSDVLYDVDSDADEDSDEALWFHDDFLTDEDDDSEHSELRGIMQNGVFVQSGGTIVYNTRLRQAVSNNTSSTAMTEESNTSSNTVATEVSDSNINVNSVGDSDDCLPLNGNEENRCDKESQVGEPHDASIQTSASRHSQVEGL